MKYIKIIIFMLIVCGTAMGQNWKPKYSVANQLNSTIHGYVDSAANNPWAVAEYLMNSGTHIESSMGMQVLSVDPNYYFERITTSGAIFYINEKHNSYHINAKVKNSVMTGATTDKNLIDITFLKEDNTAYDTFLMAADKYPLISSGRYYSLAKSRINNDPAVDIRINGDGLMMFKVLDPEIKKIKIKMHFFPAYAETSEKIPHGNSLTKYNKEDVSHLFMDEYAGFGVYLLDSEKEALTHYDGYSEVIYPVPGNNKIFWVSVFPPKGFDFNNTKALNPIVQTNYYSNFTLVYGRVKEVNSWSDDCSDPMNTFWMVSQKNDDALNNYISDSFLTLQNGTFIHFGDLTLWKNWQFNYVPRKKFASLDDFSLLKAIAGNLHAHQMDYLVYTSPHAFLDYSFYTNNQGDPFSRNNINLEELGDINYTGYSFMLNNLDDFTFHRDEPGIDETIPILTHFNMMFYEKSGAAPLDQFMSATNLPWQSFTVANREGENINKFKNAIAELKTNMGGALDGIYMDTFYEFNLPRSYQLMRDLKSAHGDGFKIFRHASAKSGQDAYLPQTDSYADFVLTGESSRDDYYDRKYWRFFVSTTNISNSIAVCFDIPSELSLVEQKAFIDRCYDYNIRLIYPTIRINNGSYTSTQDKINFVHNFWTNFPTALLKKRVEDNLMLNTQNPAFDYADLNTTWQFGGVKGDYIFSGDIDGDGMDEAITFEKTSKKWHIYSRNMIINNAEVSISCNDNDNIIPFVGDFNRDNKADLGYYRYITDRDYATVNSLISSSTTASCNFPSTPSWSRVITDAFESLTSGDFDGDNADDLLLKNGIRCLVFLSDKTSGFYYNHINFSNLELYETTGDIVLSDFNNDNKDDIAFTRTFGSDQIWKVYLSKGSEFDTTFYWVKAWYNKNGFPLAGNFDSGNYPDIAVCNTSQWNLNLSNYLDYRDGGVSYPSFINPSSGASLNFENANMHRPLALDFNGDGYDDLAVFNKNASSLFVRYTKPGEFSSPNTGMLPKENDSINTVQNYTYELRQNYPNPFNPVTNISFSLASTEHVTISVYDILGRKVRELINGEMPAGVHNVKFDGSKLASGIYIYRIQTPKFSSSKKLLLLK